MQKQTGIISGQNSTSCGIFHHESKNIRIAFFWFLYNFLHNLQETAKALLLLELPLCRKALGKISFLAMWPLVARPVRLRPQSGEGRRRGWPGTREGGARVARAGLGRNWGRGWPAARLAAALGGGSRCGPNSCVEGSGVVRLGRAVARVSAREVVGRVNSACGRLELGARRGDP
jgi:hypothetical protein